MRAVWVAVTMIGLSGPALAEDDPAVAVCEAAAKAILLSPRSYERVEAHIEGAVVILEYYSQNAQGAFIRNSVKCAFKLNDGKWNIIPPSIEIFNATIEAMTPKKRRLSELYSKVNRDGTGLSADEISEMKSIHTGLNNFLVWHSEQIMSVLADAEKQRKASEKTGLVPISPGNTSLK